MSDKPFGHLEGHMPAMKLKDEQRSDGRVFIFLVPNDAIPQDLVMAPKGTKLMLAYARYTEAEESPAGGTTGKEIASQAPAGVAKTEGERAVQRAGILAKDSDFQGWVSNVLGCIADEKRAAEYIRHRCGIESRRGLAVYPRALEEFGQILAEFHNRIEHG